MSARNINHEIIEDLYSEALLLADDARAVFGLRIGEKGDNASDSLKIALSIEGLRTTTRVMHVLAWLLNQRAFLAGELSAAQLAHHNELPEERNADPANLEALEPETRALIRESQDLHARVARLDREMRRAEDHADAPVQAMQDRLAQAFGASG
jgi:regulator of CtrA degradation